VNTSIQEWSADILSASVRSTLSATNPFENVVRAARSGGQDVRAPTG